MFQTELFITFVFIQEIFNTLTVFLSRNQHQSGEGTHVNVVMVLSASLLAA